MSAYYNEIDPFAAQWLRNLQASGHIASGFVDHDDLKNVEPTDMIGFDQCHFFAGIGVWSHALRRAGWPDSVPVWTGSCPCQPFSSAGRRKGFADDRHLWPAWFELIDVHSPPIIFGEQVASPDGLTWFDTVCDDLERAGYSVGAADLPAAGVGAPHIRQRLYFVAIANDERREGLRLQLRAGRSRTAVLEARGGGSARRLGDARREGGGRHGRRVSRSEGEGPSERIAARDLAHEPQSSSAISIMGDTERARLARRKSVSGHNGSQLATAQRAGSATSNLADSSSDELRSGRAIHTNRGSSQEPAGLRPTSGFWEDVEWLACQDGKARPTQPGLFPLAHGTTARVGRLRAYGNAIVSEVAVTFIQAVMDII